MKIDNKLKDELAVKIGQLDSQACASAIIAAVFDTLDAYPDEASIDSWQKAEELRVEALQSAIKMHDASTKSIERQEVEVSKCREEEGVFRKETQENQKRIVELMQTSLNYTERGALALENINDVLWKLLNK